MTRVPLTKVYLTAWLLNTAWLAVLSIGVTQCVDGAIVSFYVAFGSVVAVATSWAWSILERERRRKAGEA